MSGRALDEAPDLPADGLVLERGLPGWWLRVLTALSGGAVLALLLTQGQGEVVWVPALVLVGLPVLASVLVPASIAPMVAVLLTALLMVLSDPNELRPQVLAMVPLVHLFHLSCALAGILPRGGRVHLAALRRPAVRFVLVQVAVFALAAVTALVPARNTPAVLEVIALLGVTVVGLLTVRLLRR